MAFEPDGRVSFAPRIHFSADAPQRSRNRQFTDAKEAWELGAAFHSPATTARYRSYRGGVTDPGLFLRSPTPPSPDPFGLSLLSPLWLA